MSELQDLTKAGEQQSAAVQPNGSATEDTPADGAATKDNASGSAAVFGVGGGDPAQSLKNPTVTALRALLVLLICGAVACFGYIAWQQMELNRAAEEISSTATPENPSQITEKLVENPIDFETLQAETPDIYAWIYIPKTNVNLPVLQHPANDSFYLDHNRYGEYALEGAIYSQLINSKDFSDPVTVLYGHNLKNETMFTQLHYFENDEFFAENDTMYIYTPGHILTYQIIAAYQYDNRHIMNSFDFEDQAVLQEYFDFVTNPDTLIYNVREGAQLSASEDKIVQLSTCTGDSNRAIRRYIVTGVLIDDQPTY